MIFVSFSRISTILVRSVWPADGVLLEFRAPTWTRFEYLGSFVLPLRQELTCMNLLYSKWPVTKLHDHTVLKLLLLIKIPRPREQPYFSHIRTFLTLVPQQNKSRQIVNRNSFISICLSDRSHILPMIRISVLTIAQIQLG